MPLHSVSNFASISIANVYDLSFAESKTHFSFFNMLRVLPINYSCKSTHSDLCDLSAMGLADLFSGDTRQVNFVSFHSGFTYPAGYESHLMGTLRRGSPYGSVNSSLYSG
jgi:hypothetical protein